MERAGWRKGEERKWLTSPKLSTRGCPLPRVRGANDWVTDLGATNGEGWGARPASDAQCWKLKLPVAELVSKGSAGRPALEAPKVVR